MKIFIRFKLITLLFLLTPTLIFGHNIIIKGKVFDESTNSPLPGATVILKETSEGATTDEWGNFTISTNYESGILVVSYIGYATQEISFTQKTEFIAIGLKPDVINLGSVSVNGNKITPLVSIAQVDVNTRTVNNSQDVLRIVPGLFIAQHGGGGKAEQIFMRGFDADHGTDVNIFVDGLPVNMVSQAHGQGYADLHWVIPELINKVDFGKGSYYVERGDFTTAGYVEFKLKNFLDNNMVKVEGGQFNTFRTVGLFDLMGKEAGEKGKNAYAAMEYFMNDGPFEYPQNFNRLNLFFRYNQVVNQNNMFTITASAFSTNWDQSGQIPESAVDDGLISRWGSLDPTEGGNTQRYNLSVRSLHQLNDGGVFNNLIYYTRYHFDLFSNFTFYLNDPLNGDQLRQKEDRNLYGYKGSYSKTYSLDKNNTVETNFGGGFRYDDIFNSQLLHTKERYTILDTTNFGDIFETNINIFGQVTWTKKRWMLNFGLRYDAFKFQYVNKDTTAYKPDTKYQGTLSPKLNIAYNATNNVQIYAKLGKGFHSNDARVVTQNDSLPTLPNAYGADLGVSLKPASRVIINTALWYMYLESELVWSGDAGTWEPDGQTNRYGIDVSFRWQAIDWLFFDTDINYSIARYIDEPKDANYVPLSPRLTSTGGLTLIKNGWSSSLRYRYVSSNPADETNTVSTLEYFVLDLKLNYTFSKWTFGISAQNLFDTKWNEAQFASDYRVTGTSEPEYGLTYTPGTPFFVKGCICFSF
ncbi:MAG: TonB-dependent receptor [Chlorobi bacterium]|nr:TonB-dependent receptor [Chlorobiota bacterium]